MQSQILHTVRNFCFPLSPMWRKSVQPPYAMEVNRSRRILAVGAQNSGVLDLIKALTGTAPEPSDNGSAAGLTHEWNVKTAYYSAKVPIWVDEISDVEAWTTEFLKPEAKEVVQAVGAWVYCFRSTPDGLISSDVENTLRAVQKISEEHVGYGADVVMLAVATSNGKVAESSDPAKDEQWEDICIQHGFEYICTTATGTNTFGEKVGFERVKEALEANEWSDAAISDPGSLDIEDLDFDAGGDLQSVFGREEAEMTAELYGMKAAIAGNDFEPGADDFAPPLESSAQEAAQVEGLDRLMQKLLIVKEQSEDLPEDQRKRMAAKAVREIMDDAEV